MDNSNVPKFILKYLRKFTLHKYENYLRNVSFTTEIPPFLKRILYIFLYLNIYTLFTGLGYAQGFYLEITAEKSISKELKDSLSIPEDFADFQSVRREADTIQKKLQRIGFIEAGLQTLNKKNDSVFVADYIFGKRYKKLKIYYNTALFSKKELQVISDEVSSEYFVLRFENTEAALSKLNNIKANDGNVFARLRLANFKKEEGNLIRADLILDSGEKRRIDSIAVKGYEKFPRAYIKHYAGVKIGRPFNRDKLRSQNDVLNSLGFTETIKAPEVLFREDKTTIFFYLKKRNNNLFDGILGFATNEETNRLEFNGYLNLELNNNLNFGEQLLVNFKADGAEQQNFRTRVTLPYLFQSPVGTALELKIFKRDSTFITTDQSARVTYQINPASSAYVGYKASESSNLLDDLLVGNSVLDYKARYFISGVEFSTAQNDPLFPNKTVVTVSGEFGSRDFTDKSEAQTRLELNAANNFNLNYENIIFLRNTTGVLFSETFVTNELFRFGGINSIRGFNENSIDASLFSVLNTEYRYRFSSGFYLHSIVDLGYFENKTSDLKQKLYSFGVGLGLLTKAGVLKFNIANGISENQEFNFSNTKIHLSLSSRF